MIDISTMRADEAHQLSYVWSNATDNAPFCFPVPPNVFSAGIVVVETDDESLASSKSQRIIVAKKDSSVVGFAHLCTGVVEVDDEDLPCGIIRFLAFSPGSPSVGRALLEAAETYLLNQGSTHIDAFSLYHGYAFHNHKVGILSTRLDHLTSLLTDNGYHRHDGHLTLERAG
jgi:hypothetical protein